MTERVAAIDLGTNTARLLIADRSEEGFVPVCLEREIVRMGGGFSRELGLSPEAIQRGLSCLERFSALITQHGADSVRAVATSAVRDAANGADFLQAAHQRTGISLRVIDGISEGRLTLAGVLAGLDRRHDRILLFDVGGGSTEYTLVQNNEPCFIRSLPLGVVRLTEGQGTPEAMERKIRKELDALSQEMREHSCRIDHDTVLIGTAGTATTLAAIRLGMRDYDYRRVNNFVISKHEIRAIYERLLPLSPAERLEIPGLERGREDLIIAGSLITLHTMQKFGRETMKVSDYGLLEGLVVSDDAGTS
jgi:exopolyphosphatase/guanosine-5'-triphosphate,3'-diphosphate pyrophosphatase